MQRLWKRQKQLYAQTRTVFRSAVSGRSVLGAGVDALDNVLGAESERRAQWRRLVRRGRKGGRGRGNGRGERAVRERPVRRRDGHVLHARRRPDALALALERLVRRMHCDDRHARRVRRHARARAGERRRRAPARPAQRHVSESGARRVSLVGGRPVTCYTWNNAVIKEKRVGKIRCEKIPKRQRRELFWSNFDGRADGRCRCREYCDQQSEVASPCLPLFHQQLRIERIVFESIAKINHIKQFFNIKH